MPLLINCRLSRKASQDYQSTGASINITAELDATLASRPEELQRAIAALYAQARAALDRQAKPPVAPATPLPRANGQNGRGYGVNGNRFNGQRHNGNGRAPAPMSAKQRAAILAIAKHSEVDAYGTARQTFGVDFDALTSRQASELIDSLKAASVS